MLDLYKPARPNPPEAARHSFPSRCGATISAREPQPAIYPRPAATFAPMKKESNNGITELMLAASRGDAASVEALVEAGEDLDAQDVFGNTALMYAASAGRTAVAELLVSAGADMGARNRNKLTARELADRKGHAEVVRLFDHAELCRAAQDGKVQEVTRLVYEGADVNRQLQNGWTALMIAALHDRPEVVSFLLGSGADPTVETSTGWTALMMANRKGHAEVERLLREWGAEAAPDKLP